MKLRSKTLSLVAGCVATLALGSTASATISILFGDPFLTSSKGFANSDANISNGLAYGIVIEASGSDGFGATQYDGGFSLDRGILIPLATGNGTATNNQLWLSMGLGAADNDVNTHDNSVFGGGNGGISGIVGIPASAANKRFAIIWFDTQQLVGAAVANPTKFGIFTDVSFVLPNDGVSNEVFDAAAADANAKPANFGAFTTIPEPSTASLLCLLGLAGILRRKR